MTCYHPIPAHQDEPGGELRLWPPVGTANLNLPCGGCLGCKTSRASAWARRAEHEAKQYQDNSFLTLTYNDEELPTDGQLHKEHLQKFLKRLRRTADRHHPSLRRDRNRPIRYMASGEYGERTSRPHYHLLLFNCTFTDTHQVGKDLLESQLVNQLWPMGNHRLGDLTGASANYVAQYTLKKIGTTYANSDGEPIQPPFMTQSLKPAIGTQWIEKYKNDLRHGYLVTNGKKGPIPRAYKEKLKKLDPMLAEQVAHMATKNKPPQDDLTAAEQIHKRRNELSQHRPL